MLFLPTLNKNRQNENFLLSDHIWSLSAHSSIDKPGSPGSYRPVSKIARKNSLVNQQQHKSMLAAAGGGGSATGADEDKPKLVR